MLCLGLDDTPNKLSRNIIIVFLLNAKCYCIHIQYTKQLAMEFAQREIFTIYHILTDLGKYVNNSINLVCSYITQCFILSIHNI